MNNKKLTIYDISMYLILILLTVVFIYPILNMVFKSLLTGQEFVQLPPKFIPSIPQWSNYINTFTASGDSNGIPFLLLYFKNTVIVVVLSIVGGALSSCLCAYGFAKINFKGREVMFILVLATMMIPGSVMLIPLFEIFKGLHWLNTLLPLWAPAWFGGGAINIFILRQFMRTMPNEIIESGKIDGASHLRIFFQIIMPNCKAVLSVVVINFFMGCWNDLMGPLIYINDQTKWTLTLGVTNMGQGLFGSSIDQNYVMAACTMMVIPPLLIFFFFQDYFIENVVMTGIKG